MFALRQEPCAVAYRHLNTTYGCFKMRIVSFRVGYSVTGSLN